MAVIYPVIMAGGSGTRLWPLSRKAKPKQYHSVVSDNSMFVETLKRVQAGKRHLAVADPIIICSGMHKDEVLQQCQAHGIAPRSIIIEPCGRNTAPAAALAALAVNQIDPSGLILLLPADHHVDDETGFWSAVEAGLPVAADGYITTFGIQPTHPETGYGYIKTGSPLGGQTFAIDSFFEKPDLETAKAYLDDGSYYWNAGIFMFSAGAMLAEFEKIADDILASCRKALQDGKQDGVVSDLCEQTFSGCRSESVDYAIMENTGMGAIIAPVSVGWNDIGSWSAVSSLTRGSDDEKSVCIGNVISIDTTRSYIRSDGPLVAAIGVEDLVIVVTEDAILISRSDQTQDVKKVVNTLKDSDRTSLL